MTTKYILSIGLFDKDSKKLEISREAAQAMVNNEVARRFDGTTVYSADGVYRNLDGSTVREPTIRVELVFTTKEAVISLAKWAKGALNQESVMYEEVKEDVEFI